MKNFKPLLFLLILVGGLAAYFFTPLRQVMTPARLVALTHSTHGVWWMPVVLILFYGIGGLFGLPGSALTLAIGALYGVLPGFFYNVIASNLAAGAGFFGARYLGRDFVSRFLKGKWKEFDEQAASHGFRLIFYLRLVPLFPFNGINFGAGLSKVRFTDYAVASLLGMIPGTFVYTYFASSLLSRTTGAKEEATFHLILSTVLFVLLSLIPVIYKQFRK
ncbi:MAG: TVP38/TMEM64 family protein [Deltaproteobacteria bacterium]|nr:TVP38/TMEM64 family protein [Deltaproteobacteria bacterium]